MPEPVYIYSVGTDGSAFQRIAEYKRTDLPQWIQPTVNHFLDAGQAVDDIAISIPTGEGHSVNHILKLKTEKGVSKAK